MCSKLASSACGPGYKGPFCNTQQLQNTGLSFHQNCPDEHYFISHEQSQQSQESMFALKKKTSQLSLCTQGEATTTASFTKRLPRPLDRYWCHLRFTPHQQHGQLQVQLYLCRAHRDTMSPKYHWHYMDTLNCDDTFYCRTELQLRDDMDKK